MDRIDSIRTFVRVVERRSFAQAAQDLSIPRSRASEAIRQLENQLRVRLLTRTTRQVTPTPEGEEYCRRALDFLRAIDAADEAVMAVVPSGPLRIDVHGTFARHFLLPKLPGFLELYPNIQMQIGESDRFVNLVSEGIDCVIRVGEPEDSRLIGRKLGVLREGTFASPEYLRQNGVPTSPDDLHGHRMVGFVSTKTRATIPLEFVTDTGTRTVNLPVSVSVNAAESMVCLATHGLGLIQVPRYRLSSELEQGHLVEILKDFQVSKTPVYLLHPEGRHVSARARVFMDWAAEVVSDGLKDCA